MSFFSFTNMFMNNGLNCNFTPFSGYSFNNFSFFNMPFFNFGWNMPTFNFSNLNCFSNSWGASSFNNFNNISIFNNCSMPDFNYDWSSYNYSYGDTFSRSYSNSSSSIKESNSGNASSDGQKVLDKAMSYNGKVNRDADGVRLFSPAGSPSSRGWCSDFATYCASQALGSKYPKSMITGSPGGLRDAAKQNDCWVNGWSSAAKPGDIIIVPGKGVSGLHVAIIKSIDSDGKITCVSGNSRNSVRVSRYSTSSVKGFVSIEKLA